MRRPDANARGYDHRWDKASRRFKTENPLCLGCRAMGWVEAAKVTDHIIPHRGSDRLFWDRDNWQPCCAWHHDTIKQALERMYDAGEIAAEDLRLDSEPARRLSAITARDGVERARPSWAKRPR